MHVPGVAQPVRVAGLHLIVFDAAPKGYGEREPRLTHLFQAFQAHYGFDCSFCNPYSGHEKGAVESKVGMVRRKLFVPRPSVWSLENFNAGLPDRCLELATKPHYRKDTEERGLFSEDRAALPAREAFFLVGTAWSRSRDGIVIPRTGRTRAEG